MPEPIVHAERFTYAYPGDGGSAALADVTLEIEPGELCLVCGESGSGKSTLVRAACGLVPHFHGGAASGELWVAGRSVRDHGPGDLSDVCGTLLQDPESQVVMSGVRAEIALPLENRGEPPEAVARGVEEVSLALGIGSLLDRRAETLSGGELQRVALAAALVTRPALLLLDEPTSQLDPVAADELVTLLRRLNEDWGTTVVIAEHRLERCLAAADRVLALQGGTVACDSGPGEFLDWARATVPPLLPSAARLFSLAGLAPLPASVKEARGALARASLEPAVSAGGQRGGTGSPDTGVEPPAPRRLLRLRPSRRRGAAPQLAFNAVWHELRDGPAILRGIDLTVAAGERVALMGRNGAGKSTLLRHARGLLAPTRGHVERGGEVALLLQSPGDYLIHDRLDDEVDEGGLRQAGLSGRGASDPRDLSGGERQRLALEVILAGGRLPAVACLDEPTRGMDPGRKHALAERLRRLAGDGTAVVVATHDTGFAADVADRVVLMGQGVVIADGPASEVLAGGWHFATEVARVLGGAGGALTPEEGARLLEKELVG